jgi:anti-anti-sigma regulatory factor
MKITITKTEKTSPVNIIHLDGMLDGANYECLIDEAHNLYTGGVRDLILDLSNLTFISSAGLGALHQVALLFRGKNYPGQNESWAAFRWAAYRSLDRDHNPSPQEHVKLLSPTKEVRDVLDMIGFSSLFEIFTDLPQAMSSFRQTSPVIQGSLR